MKTYRAFIDEQRKETDMERMLSVRTVCDLLSLPDPPPYDFMRQRSLWYGKERRSPPPAPVDDFIQALDDWKKTGFSRTSGTERHQRNAEIIAKALDCPKIAGWARYSGRAYRGVSRKWHDVADAVPQSERDRLRARHGRKYAADSEAGAMSLPVIHYPMIGSYHTMTLTMQYRTILKAQSWSRSIATAFTFADQQSMWSDATTQAVGMVMEHEMSSRECLNLNRIYRTAIWRDAEEEVIRVGNEPISVKCHFPIFEADKMKWLSAGAEKLFDSVMTRRNP